MQLAAFSASLDILDYLVVHCKADINKRDERSDSPPIVHIALMQNDINTLQYLLSHGADIEALNQNGLTPLHFAIFTDIYVFNILLTMRANPCSKNLQGDTVAHAAIKYNKFQHLQLLLQYYPDLINETNAVGQTIRQLYPTNSQNVYVNKAQYESLKNRVTMLEEVISNVVDKTGPQQNLGNCVICKKCAARNTCPVCNRVLCPVDWVTHVMNGCKNSQ